MNYKVSFKILSLKYISVLERTYDFLINISLLESNALRIAAEKLIKR